LRNDLLLGGFWHQLCPIIPMRNSRASSLPSCNAEIEDQAVIRIHYKIFASFKLLYTQNTSGPCLTHGMPHRICRNLLRTMRKPRLFPLVLFTFCLTTQFANGQANLAIYTDHLVNGFQDWGWAPRNMGSTFVHAGTNSIAVTNASFGQAISF